MRCGALCLRRSICVLTGGLAVPVKSACGLHVTLRFPDHGPSAGARFPARCAAHRACIGSILATTGGKGWLRISRLILFGMSCFTSCAHDPIRGRMFFCSGPRAMQSRAWHMHIPARRAALPRPRLRTPLRLLPRPPHSAASPSSSLHSTSLPTAGMCGIIHISAAPRGKSNTREVTSVCP